MCACVCDSLLDRPAMRAHRDPVPEDAPLDALTQQHLLRDLKRSVPITAAQSNNNSSSSDLLSVMAGRLQSLEAQVKEAKQLLHSKVCVWLWL